MKLVWVLCAVGPREVRAGGPEEALLPDGSFAGGGVMDSLNAHTEMWNLVFYA